MSEPLVLVLLLGGGTDATTEGLMAATRRALGSDAIVLADTSDAAADSDALAIGERVHARAIARVTWDAGSSTARLHVHVSAVDRRAARDEWVDEAITFLPQDAPSEKGRTVGYTLGSMVQRLERARMEESASAAAPAVPAPLPEQPPRPAPPRERSDVDLFAAAVGALGGPASAIGGAAGVRWWPGEHVGLRIVVGGRGGTVEAASASATTLSAGFGPGVRVTFGAVEVGGRADLLILRHAMTRRHGGGLEATRSRWLGATDVVLEVAWSPSARAAVIAGVGAEVAFGPTEVKLGDTSVAELPLFRGLAEVGARFRF